MSDAALLKIVSDIARLPKDIEKWDKNRRFATAVGITWTGLDIRKGMQAHMREVFDRPTRFTLNSLGLKPAKRDDFDGRVFFRDFAPKGTAAGRYLDAQIAGGERKLKRSEKHLRRRGFLERGLYLVPGKGAKLNAAGNIPKGQVTKALSDIGAQFDPGQNTKRARKKYFWLPRSGRRLAGIYYRQGGRLIALMVAVRKPVYRRRLDFYGESRRITNKRLNTNIDRAVKRFVKL